MSPFATLVTYLVSVGIVLLDVFVIVSILFFITNAFTKDSKPHFFYSRAHFFAFFIALGSLVVSLYYSNVVGFTPCQLCWYQRIVFYPQVVILLFALLNKKLIVQKYSYQLVLTLSIIGALIAGYHYYGQTFNPSVLPCGVTAAESLCAQIPFKTFGYITIPMMSLTGFLTQIVLMMWYKISRHV